MSETSIFEEYIDLTRQNRAKYGNKTVVLMQVGVFYEVYGFVDPLSNTNDSMMTPLDEFVQVCGLNMMEKKTSGDKRMMYKEKWAVVGAGFRDYSLDKYLERLIEAGYTAVTYVQEKIGKVVRRVFDAVHSSGTHLSDEPHVVSNNICCLWIEMMHHRGSRSESRGTKVASSLSTNLVIGIAVANMFTGTSSVCEWVQPFGLEPSACDKLERMVTIHNPSEFIVVSNVPSESLAKMMQYSGISVEGRVTLHTVDLATSPIAKNCSQQKYTRHCLDSLYGGPHVVDHCQEFTNFPTATQAFVFLLDFIKEHNPNLVKNIDKPQFQHSERMLLANHTLRQLNICSVEASLNQCCTAMGKRRFHDELVHPTTDMDWLESQYVSTSVILETVPAAMMDKVRHRLKEMRDVEKMARQLVLRKLPPVAMKHLHRTLELASLVFADLGRVAPPALVPFREFLEKHFRLDKMDNHSLDNYLQPRVSAELDACVALYEDRLAQFHAFHRHLNELMQHPQQPQQEFVRIHETEKSGLSLQITKRRAVILKQKVEPGWTFRGTASGNYDDVTCPVLTEVCATLLTQKDVLQKVVATTYQEILAAMEEQFYGDFVEIAKSVGQLDVYLCKAHIARKYKYCRPQLRTDAPKAGVDAKQLRHALIEQLQTTSETYVANDVMIGMDGQDGILLYGTNAVGKTSLIRALGIAIIMAQAGMYVPCTEFVLHPYTAIFSRILANDDLFKGLSTFAVEMSELRVILKMADENSLILGDELCSGTETESALSIFVAGLATLSQKQSSFLFATHFHEIVKYDEVARLATLRLKHMAVHYNRETDALVYDRVLRDGPGDRMYGLEVCKALHLPKEFLDMAYNLRCKYFPNTRGDLSHGSSVYNSGKIRGMCELCGERVSTETHHVVPQHLADAEGFISTARGVFHKNHVANLQSLCETCHLQQH